MDTFETIICKDCEKPFLFTGSEQRFYKSQGWEKPIRCKNCRERKKMRHREADKYYGLHEAMRNSCSKRRDTKGTVVNRSGSSWEHIDIAYMPDALLDTISLENEDWMKDWLLDDSICF